MFNLDFMILEVSFSLNDSVISGVRECFQQLCVGSLPELAFPNMAFLQPTPFVPCNLPPGAGEPFMGWFPILRRGFLFQLFSAWDQKGISRTISAFGKRQH